MARRRQFGSDVWDRREDEGAQAYEAFSIYRDMNSDDEKRSLAKVGSRLGKSTKLMERWSRLYDWVERAQAYDMYIEHEALVKASKRRSEARARQIEAGRMLQEIGLDAIQKLIVDKPEVAMKMIVEGAKLEAKMFELEQLEKERQIQSEDTSGVVINITRLHPATPIPLDNFGDEEEKEDVE